MKKNYLKWGLPKGRMLAMLLLGVFLFVAFLSTYLVYLYNHLESEFEAHNQFVPTRIYSDVTTIQIGTHRTYVDARLKALAYTPQVTAPERVELIMHTPTYPDYLGSGEKPASAILEFQDQRVSKITLTSSTTSDAKELILEPELVATLGGSTARASIRDYLKFEDIPASIWKAIIAIEDQHFLEHKGFDPRGLVRAVWINLKSFRYAQGGSTITQQLVKNLTGHRRRSILRKINELLLSILLEFKYDKEQILERYLNEVYLGQVGNFEIHGVAEGAKAFFGKSVMDLNLAETAILASVIRGPAYYSPYHYKDRLLERQKWVLKRMSEEGLISDTEYKETLQQRVAFAPQPPAGSRAPFFSDFVKAELLQYFKGQTPSMTEDELAAAGYKVYTTIDPTLNQQAQKSVSDTVGELEKNLKIGAGNPRLEGVLIALDNTESRIKALVGGRNYGTSNFNRVLNMKRQIGSTFKPIVYLSALKKEVAPDGTPYSPGHPVIDAPWTLNYDHDRQTWSPKNYEKDYLGWTTMRLALAKSINTVAARLATEVGIPYIIETARSLGIQSDLPNVPSLALGVAELSPIELIRAYSTIARHGQTALPSSGPLLIRAITHEDGKGVFRNVFIPETVIEPKYPLLLSEMLKSVFTEGSAISAARLGFKEVASGKTGTTSNYRDAWFAGFTERWTTITWVGFDQDKNAGEKAVKLTGASAALPVWVSFVKEAIKFSAPEMPTSSSLISENLIKVKMDKYTGKVATSSCSDTQKIEDWALKSVDKQGTSCENGYHPVLEITRID